MAKEANEENPISFNILKGSPVENVFSFQGSLVNISPREFAKASNRIIQIFKWTCLNRFDNTKIFSKDKEKDWNLFWKVLRPKRGTKVKWHQQTSWKVKIIHDELPTGERLHQRRPDLYEKNIKCMWCKTENEMLDHLLLCTTNPGWVTYVMELENYCRGKLESLNVQKNMERMLVKGLVEILTRDTYVKRTQSGSIPEHIMDPAWSVLKPMRQQKF